MLSMVIDSISSFMYSKLLVIMLIGTGVYFTIRTKFPQVRLFRSACKAVMEKPDDEDAVSSFQALMVSTASRVGTGNIVGVSSAICIGGFGAVFWMWVIAIIGSASAFVESTLAQIYKKKGEDGTCYGGPAYYIEAALRCRPLAIAFCIAMIATYAFGFNMLASYNLQSTFAGFSCRCDTVDHRRDSGSSDRMVSAGRRFTYYKSNFDAGTGYGCGIYCGGFDRGCDQYQIYSRCVCNDFQGSI